MSLTQNFLSLIGILILLTLLGLLLPTYLRVFTLLMKEQKVSLDQVWSGFSLLALVLAIVWLISPAYIAAVSTVKGILFVAICLGFVSLFSSQ